MKEMKYKTKFESIEKLLEEKKPQKVGLLSCYGAEGLWTLDKDIALLCEFTGIEMGHLWQGPSSYPRKTPLLKEHSGPGFDLVIVTYDCPCGFGILIPEYGQEIKEKGITDQVYFAAAQGIKCLEHVEEEFQEGGEQKKEELVHLIEEWGVGIEKTMARVRRMDQELREQVGMDYRKFPHLFETSYPVPERKWYGLG